MIKQYFGKAFLALFSTAALSGCAGLQTRSAKIGTVSAFVSRGDLRTITERTGPDGQHILCAEPSPDVVLALSQAFSAAPNVSVPGPGGAAIQVGGTFSGNSNETATALAGRTASVVALRDSLFRACEAYGNGAITKDAYSLILSQYGDLLVTLMLGETAGSSTAASKPSTPTSAPSGAGASAAPATPSIANNVSFSTAPAAATPKAVATPAPKDTAPATGAAANPPATPALPDGALGVANLYYSRGAEVQRLTKAIFVLCATHDTASNHAPELTSFCSAATDTKHLPKLIDYALGITEPSNASAANPSPAAPPKHAAKPAPKAKKIKKRTKK